MTTERTEFFTDPDDVETVLLDNDQEWVKIKRTLSIGDQDRLSEMLFNVTVKPKESDNMLSRAERRRRARENPSENMEATFRPSTAALLEISIT